MAHVANVTIDHTKVSADLTDYPVYVDLADLNTAFWDTVANGGGDIRCYKSDGTTELPREVVSCDTSGDTGELWIKYTGTLSSSADTVIQIHADGTSLDYATNATYGAENVWNSSFRAVYHLEESAGSAADSTGNGHNGTFAGSLPDKVTGEIGSAQDFDGTGDYIDLGTLGDMGSTLETNKPTVSFWIKTSDTAQFRPFGCTNTGDNYPRFFPIFNRTSSGGTQTGAIQMWMYDDDGNTLRGGVDTDTGIIDGTLHKITIQIDGPNNTLKIYVDGVSQTIAYEDQTTPDNFTDNFTDFYMGGHYNNGSLSGEITGVLDEFRIYNENTSSDWETTEKNNQSSPSTFYTVTDAGYTLVCDVGSFVLTGLDTGLYKASKLLCEVGTFTLTGLDVILSKGYYLICEAGSFALTGLDATITKASKLVCEVGAFTLTGFDAILSKTYKLICAVGSFILTGKKASLYYDGSIWTNESENDTTFTNESENDTTFTNLDKH